MNAMEAALGVQRGRFEVWALEGKAYREEGGSEVSMVVYDPRLSTCTASFVLPSVGGRRSPPTSHMPRRKTYNQPSLSPHPND